MKPTVGRTVHFYTAEEARHSNGMGEGPYPATITQVFNPDADDVMCNLHVLRDMGTPYNVGSVFHKDHAMDTGASHYWEWPPREEE